jgi:hypothetical protein
MDIVVWRNDESKTAIKGNDGNGWNFDDVVLWVGRRQNRDTVE